MKKKLLTFIIIISIILILIPNISLCLSLDDIVRGANTFTSAANSSIATVDKTQLRLNMQGLLGIAMGVGVVIVLIVGVYLGIKFMGDSTNQKVEVKESLIPFVIGSAIVLGGAYLIWSILVNATSGL